MAFIEINKTAQSADKLVISKDGAVHIVCKSPDKLARLVEAIFQNENVHYLSDGDWSLHDLLNVLIDKLGPAELYLTTYAIREFAVRQLVAALHAKKLISVTMLVDYRAKIRTPEVYQLAENTMSTIALTSIHAKVAVLRSAHAIVAIVGSSNLTSNPRIEAGVVTTNKKVAECHIDWIQKIVANAEIFK